MLLLGYIHRNMSWLSEGRQGALRSSLNQNRRDPKGLETIGGKKETNIMERSIVARGGKETPGPLSPPRACKWSIFPHLMSATLPVNCLQALARQEYMVSVA